MTFDRVLSAVRALMAKELVARGLSVNETARLLGLTPAAVSMYISGKRGESWRRSWPETRESWLLSKATAR